MTECKIDGCANQSGLPGSARGLCRAHYRRWERYGDEQEPSRRLLSYEGDICTETECSKQAVANGLCGNHYAVTRRRGNPEGCRIRNLAFKQRYRSKQEDAMGRPRPLLCELCLDPGIGRGNKPNAGICFDHDHATGLPRGWLCDRCNKVLGLVRDDQSLLSRMMRYLKDGNPFGFVEKQDAEMTFEDHAP